jgi:hypothetical protein
VQYAEFASSIAVSVYQEHLQSSLLRCVQGQSITQLPGCLPHALPGSQNQSRYVPLCSRFVEDLDGKLNALH